MGPKKRVKKCEDDDNTNDTKLYCVCRKADDGEKFMVKCDLCCNWFHGECVGVSDKCVLEGDWFCDSCVALNHTRHKLIKEMEDLLACKNALSATSKLEGDNASLRQEIADSKEKLLALSNDLGNSKASNDVYRKEMTEKLIVTNNTIEVLKTEKAGLLQALEIHRKATDDNNNEKASFIEKLADANSTIDKLREENVELSLRSTDLEEKVVLLNNDKHHWEDAFKLFETDMKEKLADAGNIIENLKAENAALQAKLKVKKRLSLSSQKQNISKPLGE